MGALKLGVHIGLDEIRADEFCAMLITAEERDLLEREKFPGWGQPSYLTPDLPKRCATDRAESADADIEMTRRKAFPAILRLRDRSYRKPIE